MFEKDNLQNEMERLTTAINKQVDAHLFESIISLFNQGILKHYIKSPRSNYDASNFAMTVECASGVTFEGREKIIELEQKLAKAVEVITECLYHTSMRDSQINTHKQACDSVEYISSKFLKELGE